MLKGKILNGRPPKCTGLECSQYVATLAPSGVRASFTRFPVVVQNKGNTTTGYHLSTLRVGNHTELRRRARFAGHLEQILGVILDAVLFQELLQFLCKASLAMMLLLSLNIPAHRLHPARAHGEDGIALLPFKLRFMML